MPSIQSSFGRSISLSLVPRYKENIVTTALATSMFTCVKSLIKVALPTSCTHSLLVPEQRRRRQRRARHRRLVLDVTKARRHRRRHRRPRRRHSRGQALESLFHRGRHLSHRRRHAALGSEVARLIRKLQILESPVDVRLLAVHRRRDSVFAWAPVRGTDDAVLFCGLEGFEETQHLADAAAYGEVVYRYLVALSMRKLSIHNPFGRTCLMRPLGLMMNEPLRAIPWSSSRTP